MPKIFMGYCASLLVLFATAQHQGYVFSSLFSGVQKADKMANRYHK